MLKNVPLATETGGSQPLALVVWLSTRGLEVTMDRLSSLIEVLRVRD